MDKNKDFIRLDDVFKGLEHGEDQYRSGAWGQMKDLLDKEMPLASGASSGASMYRYLIPLFVLLLSGVGYYLWNNSLNNSLPLESSAINVKADINENKANSVAPSKDMIDQNKVIQKKPGDKRPESIVATGDKETNHSISSNSSHKNPNKQESNLSRSGNVSAIRKASLLKNVNSVLLAQEGSSNSPANEKEKISGAHDQETLSVNSAVSNNNDVNVISALSSIKLNSKKETINSKFQKKSISKEIIALQQSLPVLQKETVIQQFKPALKETTAENHPPLDAAEDLVKENKLTKVPDPNNNNLYQAENGGWYKEQRDTFRRLKLVRRNSNTITKDLYKPPVPVYDTLSSTRIAKVSFIPLSYAELKLNQLEPKIETVALIPNAKISPTQFQSEAAEKNMINLVPLQHYKVSSRQMDASAISRLLQSANSGISGLTDGSKNWYISLLIGGNAGISSPNSYGMQIGASFLYSIAERWTLSLGVKYQNSYYPNFQFWDSAISYILKEDQTPNGTMFSGTESVHQTSVKANNLSRLSIPVLLSYNLGRVSLFGGPEFSYFLPLKNQKATSVQSSYVSKFAYDNKNPFTEQSSRLSPATDFHSRFAAGYSFGLSYDFSRNLSVDVRMSQMLWDNTGKYKLDALRNIYRQPAVEVNLDFFLGRREKVIYIMDKNR